MGIIVPRPRPIPPGATDEEIRAIREADIRDLERIIAINRSETKRVVWGFVLLVVVVLVVLWLTPAEGQRVEIREPADGGSGGAMIGAPLEMAQCFDFPIFVQVTDTTHVVVETSPGLDAVHVWPGTKAGPAATLWPAANSSWAIVWINPREAGDQWVRIGNETRKVRVYEWRAMCRRRAVGGPRWAR